MDDLEEAITAARQAVESTPSDHPARAGWLSNLGSKLKSRYKRTGQMADLEGASTSFCSAWGCTAAIPFHRITAAARCLELLITQQEIGRAAQLGKDIIQLMPAVSTRLLDRKDQQAAISTFASVASSLCAILLELGHHEDALHFLEQGRAVIIGQVIDRQRDASDLALQHPILARRYESLAREVNTPLRNFEDKGIKATALARQRRAVDEILACITEIRALPGHDRFLLGQTVAEMQETAIDSSIVIVNIADYRSDAIVISRKKVVALPLPGLPAAEAKAWLNKD